LGSGAQVHDWASAVIVSSDPLINTSIPVDTDDVLEAAVACDGCKGNHCDALLDQADGYTPPEKTPWVDPPIGGSEDGG
jgi:hypothetical protein